jgi:hypothetical protein
MTCVLDDYITRVFDVMCWAQKHPYVNDVELIHQDDVSSEILVHFIVNSAKIIMRADNENYINLPSARFNTNPQSFFAMLDMCFAEPWKRIHCKPLPL